MGISFGFVAPRSAYLVWLRKGVEMGALANMICAEPPFTGPTRVPLSLPICSLRDPMSTVLLAELNFYRTERPHLITNGITEYNAQCTELKRRWDVMQAIKAAAPPPAPVPAVGEVVLDDPLGAGDISAMSLELTRVDTSGPTVKYIYVQ
eukprot:1689385-Prymnesium_polylepis.1